jgi:hypothetical protein
MRLRDLIDLVESMENRDSTFYHVTLTENLPSIMEKGLLPTIGDRSKKIGENSCVFLFPTRDEAEQGVDNWLGDEVEEDKALALLEVTLPPEIEVFQTEGVDWEFYTRVTIPPQCLSILSRNL